MRPKGSRNTLVKIDYDVIGRLAGISGGTAKAYAQRGEYSCNGFWTFAQIQLNGIHRHSVLSCSIDCYYVENKRYLIHCG